MQMTNGANFQRADPMLCSCLVQTLEIYEKALSFDFTAILLNETLDDPSSTNLPSSWKEFVEKPETVANLFRIIKTNIPHETQQSIKMKACQCLQHLANIRHSLFENSETRIKYVTFFVTECIHMLQSPALSNYILKDRAIYKEFVPIFCKLQNNF